MSMSEEQDEIPRQPFNSTVAVVVVLIILAALAIVIGVFAFQTARQSEAGNLITVPGDYATIQAAIDAAKPGDVIQVSAGIYAENLTLNKPVSLVAESFDQINPANNLTIIDGVT